MLLQRSVSRFEALKVAFQKSRLNQVVLQQGRNLACNNEQYQGSYHDDVLDFSSGSRTS
jgi:hypothetical protein